MIDKIIKHAEQGGLFKHLQTGCKAKVLGFGGVYYVKKPEDSDLHIMWGFVNADGSMITDSVCNLDKFIVSFEFIEP